MSEHAVGPPGRPCAWKLSCTDCPGPRAHPVPSSRPPECTALTDPLGDQTDAITVCGNCADNRHAGTADRPRLTTVSVPMNPDPQEFDTENEAASVPDAGGADDGGRALWLGLPEPLFVADGVLEPVEAAA